MPRYTIELATMAYVSVEIDAADEDAAAEVVLDGPALPKRLVSIATTAGMPVSAEAWIDHKGWEVNHVESA